MFYIYFAVYINEGALLKLPAKGLRLHPLEALEIICLRAKQENQQKQ